jgi:hypothetical protein
MGGEVNKEGKGIWHVYFLYMYEYKTSKPTEVILRRGRREKENNGGDEPNGYIVHVYGYVIMKCLVQL